ncbi:CHAT domain-containing protein [Actinomadura sp. LD22]|uniref:CHAT domain-containing protein n=1 Tax=Actinomadura physcomitrii TaxID=2650748 RepID=A0A6I4MH21_9ACTN|nr:CHAT domain-containing protein [Actinomadura physcomitrii]MWA03307.1 CHAT domain-containing protein [Actinomadura physcomitrii]
MSPDPEGLFPRVIVRHRSRCRRCGHEADYEVPRLVDWRDREALDLLKARVPVFGCAGCDAPVSLDVPVVVLRPGDPIAVVVGFPDETTVEADAESLRELLSHPSVPVPTDSDKPRFVPVRSAHVGTVAGRYSGFVLAGLDVEPPEDWTETERAWFAAIREMVDVPDVPAEVGEFLMAPDDVSAIRVARRADALLNPVWDLVADELIVRTLAVQGDQEAAAVVRGRRTLLRRLRNAGPDEPGLDGKAADLMDEATRGDDPFAPARVAALSRLVEELRGRPDADVLLTAALISHAATVSGAPGRTPDDLRAALESGAEAVALAPRVFGPDHEYTRRANQDYAALLLDRQQGDPAENASRAMELLAEVARSSVRAGSNGLADVLQNWAAALSHHNPGGRVDNQVRALALHRDALHVHRVLRPRDRRGELLIRINFAAALRESRVRNIVESTREAIRMYTEILADPAAEELLRPFESAQAAGNLVTAKFQLRQLKPEEMAVSEVVAAALDAVALCEGQAEGDPYRIRSMSNIGGVLSHLPDDELAQESPAQLAVRFTGQAYREARAWLPAGHDERIRLGVNHAAALVNRDSEEEADRTKGLELFHELLEEADKDRQPGHRVALAANLGRLHCRERRWPEAAEAFELALDAVTRLYREARTPASRLAELGEAADLGGWLAAMYLVQDDTLRTRDGIERTRSRLLWDDAADPRAPVGPIPEDGRPVLYIGTGPLLSWILLDRPGSSAPFGVRIQLTSDELRPLVREFRGARTPEEVVAAVDALTELLDERILTPVRLLLEAAEVTDVDVVVSGLLSGLPLHAMATEGRPCWLDQAVVRYIPSRRVAERWSSAEPLAGAPGAVVSVAGPQRELDCARYEPELIPEQLGPRLPMPPEGDRSGWLLESLQTASVAHLACHARWDPDDPLRSYIDLGEPHRVLLEGLLGLRCPSLRLVVLSCCSTGVPVERWSDELIGFGTGLLVTGARAVVVGNWDLGDLAGSLLMARFYDRVGAGAEPAAALRDAQLWLSRATVAEIGALVDEALDADDGGAFLPGGLATEALQVLGDGGVPHHRPFGHAVHWAGYSYHGGVFGGGDAA